jgi:hypothetical protein
VRKIAGSLLIFLSERNTPPCSGRLKASDPSETIDEHMQFAAMARTDDRARRRSLL